MDVELELTVRPGGDFTIEVVNGQNSTCLSKTAGFEEALGEVTDRTLKPEAMIEPVKAQHTQTVTASM